MDRAAGRSEQYETHLKLLEAADRAGFHALHLAEHHATPLGMAPSPGIFLAAAAQRTRRLRLGPLVYTLALYQPLRVIEEICMLDQLSPRTLRGSVSGAASHPTSLPITASAPRTLRHYMPRHWRSFSKG